MRDIFYIDRDEDSTLDARLNRITLPKDRAQGLWVRSDHEIHFDKPAVGVVGARSASTYGCRMARIIGRELAAAGYVVVSGLARGIDGEAHRGALETGATLAMLGCGIDRAYPASHAELYESISMAPGSAVLSEFGPGTEPAPWRFVTRNRLIVALVEAVIVVEARMRSGSLITAEFANDYGVPVFAVPGEVTSRTAVGTNELIQKGARIYTTRDAFLAEMTGAVTR